MFDSVPFFPTFCNYVKQQDNKLTPIKVKINISQGETTPFRQSIAKNECILLMRTRFNVLFAKKNQQNCFILETTPTK